MPIGIILPNEVNLINLKQAIDKLSACPSNHDPIPRMKKVMDHTVVYYNHTISDKVFQTSNHAKDFGAYLMVLRSVQHDHAPEIGVMNRIYKLSEAKQFLDQLYSELK